MEHGSGPFHVSGYTKGESAVNTAGSDKHSERLYELDWLRMFAVLTLLYFHSSRPFDRWFWHLKNSVFSEGLTAVNLFINIWHMPLFFFLSGAASWFALQYRSGKEYAGERFLRLFIPLVFGMLVIIPPQVYCERFFRGQFRGSFLSFYPHVFQGVYPDGNLSWHHLWFLAYLFVFSLLALPLFLHVRNNPKSGFLAARMKRIETPLGLLLIPALPLALYELVLRPFWPSGVQNLVDDWANFFFYLTVFIYGFLMMSNEGVRAAVKRHGMKAFVPAIVSAVLILVSYFFVSRDTFSPFMGKAADSLYRIVWAFSCWFWLTAIVSFGMNYLRVNNKLLKYSNEAVLPFYILHQTVIVIIAYFVVTWRIGIAGKLVFLIVASFVGSLAAYDLIVRRFRVTRFLFGMRLKR